MPRTPKNEQRRYFSRNYTCYICARRLGPSVLASEAFAELSEWDKTRMEVSLHLNPGASDDATEPATSRIAANSASDPGIIPVCFLCSEAVQRYFTVEERNRYLSDPTVLKRVMKQIGWLKLRTGRQNELPLIRDLDMHDWKSPCMTVRYRWREEELYADRARQQLHPNRIRLGRPDKLHSCDKKRQDIERPVERDMLDSGGQSTVTGSFSAITREDTGSNLITREEAMQMISRALQAHRQAEKDRIPAQGHITGAELARVEELEREVRHLRQELDKYKAEETDMLNVVAKLATLDVNVQCIERWQSVTMRPPQSRGSSLASADVSSPGNLSKRRHATPDSSSNSGCSSRASPDIPTTKRQKSINLLSGYDERSSMTAAPPSRSLIRYQPPVGSGFGGSTAIEAALADLSVNDEPRPGNWLVRASQYP